MTTETRHDPLCGLEGVLCPSCDNAIEDAWVAAAPVPAWHDPAHAYLCAVPECPKYVGAQGKPAPVVVTIPDTCPPQAVGPFTDAELDAWAIGEAVRIYQAAWDAHPEEKPARWNAQTALVNLIGDGYVVAELRPVRS